MQLFTLSISAQNINLDSLNNKIDSLSRELTKTYDDYKKVDILNRIGRIKSNISLEDAKPYLIQALELANMIKYQKGIADNYRFNAIYYYNKYMYKEAIEYFQKSRDIYQIINDTSVLANTYEILGFSYTYLGNYCQAIEEYQKSNQYYLSNNNKNGIIQSFVQLGNVYSHQTKYYNASEMYLQALKYASEINDLKWIAHCFFNLGNINNNLSKFTEAINYFYQGLEIANKLGDKDILCTNYYNLGEIYKKINKLDSAMDFYEKAYNIAKEINNLKILAYSLSSEAGIYILNNDINTGLKLYEQAANIFKDINYNNGLAEVYYSIAQVLISSNKNLPKAKELLENAYSFSYNSGQLYTLMYTYKNFSDYYKAIGNYKKALEYKDLFIETKDSIFNIENNVKIENLEAHQKIEVKDKEIQILQNENDYNHLQRNFFFVSLILIVIISIVLFLFFWKKRKANLRLNEQNRIITDSALELQELNADLINKEQELIEANGAKDKFFSIMAHDIKNPLSILITATEYLSDPEVTISMDEVIQLAKALHKNTRNLFELLENLLTWSRSQRGILSFYLEEIQVSELFMMTHYLLQSNAVKKNVSIIEELDEDITIVADKNMIATVLRNLVSNSIKFSNENGRIILKAIENDDSIEFSIIDNGIGIKEEDKSKLFRIDISHTTIGTSKEKGTGLGLILCKEFVEKHNGQIWVESKLGAGSKFMFTIPKRKLVVEKF
jgi:signal transduction histidine kinase